MLLSNAENMHSKCKALLKLQMQRRAGTVQKLGFVLGYTSGFAHVARPQILTSVQRAQARWDAPPLQMNRKRLSAANPTAMLTLGAQWIVFCRTSANATNELRRQSPRGTGLQWPIIKTPGLVITAVVVVRLHDRTRFQALLLQVRFERVRPPLASCQELG